MATLESFTTELARLGTTFARNLAHYHGTGYDEASLRQEFLNPFFNALGWDVENRAGRIPSQREVEIESRTHIGGRQKRADYLFRTDGHDRFVCEAKKPAETLDNRHAFQAKRYAWNKGLAIALLTDFEELKLFIVGARPSAGEADAGLWKTWSHLELPTAARELWDLLARDSVAAGSLDRLIESLPKKAPRAGAKARQQWLIRPDRARALDADFLNFLDESRRTLAQDLLKENNRDALLADNRLNEASQHILDRLLFLRICEDRDIDTGMRLNSIVGAWQSTWQKPVTWKSNLPLIRESDPEPAPIAAPPDALWHAVVKHFRALDRRPPSHVPFFNGNLFKPHFSEDLLVSDDWLASFILDISSDESPYLFNVIPVEILGTIYERFLGKIVRPHGRGVVIEEKPEVRKAGGVYYTPRYIVDYIVEQTVGKLLGDIASPSPLAGEGRGEGSTPNLKSFTTRTHALRILDPACGSGSFLIRAFERVCEHWQQRLTADLRATTSDATPSPPAGEGRGEGAAWLKQHRQFCWVEPATGDVHLTVDLKRKILTHNIYGVDLDAAAVEVTQLSLYLKMLENENRTTLARERDLFPDATALLPPLQDNIKCGNSLIASDFSMIPEDLVRVKAFDWPVQFKSIMDKGGFDAVIGNPPYLNIDDTWGKGDLQLQAIKSLYPHIYNDKTDILFYFIAKAFELTRNQVGLIVSRAFLEAFKADKLRGFLASTQAVSAIVDFQNFYVFDGVGITTCLLQLEKNTQNASLEACKLLMDKLPSDNLAALLGQPDVFQRNTIPRAALSAANWTFAAPEITALNIRVDARGQPLGSILHIGQGMQTGCNEVFGERTLAEMNAWKVPNTLYRFRASNSDMQRYDVRDRGEVLLWLEDCPSFEKLPTGLRKHLESCAIQLKARAAYKRGNCDWWRFTWPLHREFYSRKRLVCPFLATENRFALVDDGRFIGLTDTTVLFDNEQPESLKYLLALLNSRLLTVRFRSIGKLKGAGIYEYFWNSISKLPIRRLDFSIPADKARHDQLVALVDKMLVLTPKLRAATSDTEKATLQNAVTATDRQIDALVYELYGLSPAEIALVEGVAESKTA